VGFSFLDWRLLRPTTPYIGLDNYAELFNDPIWWDSVIHTVYFAFMTVLGTTFVGLMAALAVTRPVRGAGFFRVLLYVPQLLSVGAMALIWNWLLSGQFGVINYLLSFLGVRPINWLGEPTLVIPALSAATIWWTFGFPMLIFVAGLQGIPEHLYEAAKIDGATGWQSFRFITLPLLRPTILFIMVTGIISHFQVFGQPYIISGGGGPGRSSWTVIIYLYNQAWIAFRMGYGAAVAVAIAIIMAAITAFQFAVISGALSTRGGASNEHQTYCNAPLSRHLRLSVRDWRARGVSIADCGLAILHDQSGGQSLASQDHPHGANHRCLSGYLHPAGYPAGHVAAQQRLRGDRLYPRGPGDLHPRGLRFFPAALPWQQAAVLHPADHDHDPGQVTLIPNYLLMRDLKWLDSFNALIFPGAANVFGVFLLRQFFMQVPHRLEEAAVLDGCGYFGRFRHVIMPLSTNALTALAIFVFLGHFNDLFWPIIVTSTLETRTLPVGLSIMQSSYAGQYRPMILAGAVVSTLPVLIVYVIFQRRIIQGVTLTGMGGR
jgi:multiple sugar transport system permease protein